MLQLYMYLAFYHLLHLYPIVSAKDFTIIGLFEQDEIVARKAFDFAIDEANRNSTTIKLRPVTPFWTPGNMSEQYSSVCQAFLEKPVAIFGSKWDLLNEEINLLSSVKELPYFQTYPHDLPNSFSLYPSSKTVASAMESLIQFYKWNSFLILYESWNQIPEFLTNLNSNVKVTFRRLPEDGGYSDLIKQINEDLKEARIIIQADLKTRQLFFQQLSELNNTESYHFIFADLDTADINSNSTISGVSLIQQNDQSNRLRAHLQLPPSKTGIPTAAGVIYDSVMLLSKTLETNHHLESESISCRLDLPWSKGAELMEALKQTEFDGATGHVKLDSYGKRNVSIMSAFQLTREGLKELGTLHEEGQTNLTLIVKPIGTRVLRVTTVLQEPFVMLRKSDNGLPLTGNDRFEGYIIDLLNEIVKIVDFNYTMEEAPDKVFGVKNDKGEWNGVIGQLIRHEADLAVCSLTINLERSEVVSFTGPYMHAGLSILYKRPIKKEPSVFAILAPLSYEVWLCIMLAYIVVSLALPVFSRFSPDKWSNLANSDVVDNTFNWKNSFWFTVGSLMQQGSDMAPRAHATRLVAGFWWFFTLILISSYTANLATFLIAERMISPIENVDDLAQQTKIKYGIKENSAQMAFFRDSKIPMYEKMWAYMQTAQPSVFVKNDSEGIHRVKEEEYAYLANSDIIEYYTRRDCSLKKIGDNLDSKGYGFALQKDSPYLRQISAAILTLQDRTKLTELQYKWWKQNGGGQCDTVNDQGTPTNALTLSNVAGAFVLLLIGLALGLLVAILDFVCKAGKKRKAKESLVKIIRQEVKSALQGQKRGKVASSQTNVEL